MQSSQPNPFTNTRNALLSLESRLNCVVCKCLATSPVTLGGCEHIFCSICCENYLGRCCPVCDLPAHVKDAEVDRQLFNMATLCLRLRDILDEVNGKNTNIEDNAVDIYCTPNQGASKLDVQTCERDKHIITKLKPKTTKPEHKKGKENEISAPTEPKRKSSGKGRRRSAPAPTSDSSDTTLLPKDVESVDNGVTIVEKMDIIEGSHNKVMSGTAESSHETVIKNIRKRGRKSKGMNIADGDKNDVEKMDISETVDASSDTVAGNSRRKGSLAESKTKPDSNNSSDSTVESTKFLVNDAIENNSTATSEDIVVRSDISSELPKPKKVSMKTTRQRKSTGISNNVKELTNSASKNKNKTDKKYPKSNVCDEDAETMAEGQDSSDKRISKSGRTRKNTAKAKTVSEGKAGENDDTTDINTSILPDTTDAFETERLVTLTGKRKLTALKGTNAGHEKNIVANKKILKGEVKTPRLKTSLKEINSPGLNKKNAKGETLLHVAAIKNDVVKVEQLLKDGANPNVRDNAGWTPLHEACNHGYTEVARLLLDHGAMMNVPGFENDSPLHDAVSNNRIDCVRLLVSRGASVTARNLHGLTPVDYAKSQEMKDALQTTVAETVQTKEVIDILEYQQPCLLGTGLSREEKSLLQKTANQLKVKLSEEVTPEVTHIVTRCNDAGMGPRTTKVVQGILSGKWILGIEWLSMCKEMNSLVCEEAFEIPGLSMFPDCKSPYKGRMNRKQQLPGLFDGCWFYFSGDFEFSVPPKTDLVETIKLGGGKFLTREPKPGHLDQNTLTVPYHADKDSEIKDCCIFIVFVTGSKFKPIRTQYICSVPASWLIDCAATFTLLPLPKY